MTTDATAGEAPTPELRPETVASAEALSGPDAAEADAPALPEIEYPVGSTRRAIFDFLLDTVEAGPQSVAQILSMLPPGTSKNTGESAIKREFDSGRIERVGPGLYVLAKPKSPGAPPAPPPEPEPGSLSDEEWLAALDAWLIDPTTWDVEQLGPPRDQANHRIPRDVAARFAARLRRREDGKAAADQRAIADAALLAKLKGATGGNFEVGPGIEDLAPIKAALEIVPLDTILAAIRYKTDKKLCPTNEPATSWRLVPLLKAIAQHFCRFDVVPRLVDAWSAAKAPQRRATAPAVQSIPRAGKRTSGAPAAA
jgi:hypothetical protein